MRKNTIKLKSLSGVTLLAMAISIGLPQVASAKESQKNSKSSRSVLLAQNKNRPAKGRPTMSDETGQPKYKTVREDASGGGDYFKGRPHPEDHNVFFGLGMNFFREFGMQFRYAYQAVEDGFIPDVNDAFYVEGGLGLTFYGTEKGKDNVTGFSFMAMGRWDFQMDDRWIFFGNLGFGYTAVTELGVKDVGGGGFFPAVGAGAMFNVDPQWAIRADLSYQFFGAGVLYRFLP
ncbi:MAG: hypothetical protein AB1540_05905 [Bdellovibrionota bacterium]